MFIGKIGRGNSVHALGKGTRTSDGWEFTYSFCGADHATNRGAPTYRILGELETNKERVTCKKCKAKVV